MGVIPSKDIDLLSAGITKDETKDTLITDLKNNYGENIIGEYDDNLIYISGYGTYGIFLSPIENGYSYIYTNFENKTKERRRILFQNKIINEKYKFVAYFLFLHENKIQDEDKDLINELCFIK
jgi:hypothetical protein